VSAILAAPPREIDGFIVQERVHSGPLSEVYSVRPGPVGARTDFPLLMKVPRTGIGEGGQSLLGFETEISVLPLLTGPHVPRFVAAGPVHRTPYIVLERVEGRSLATLIEERARFETEELTRIGAALADALHDLHRQQAIHFDLKPENVIIRPSGEAVLIDFGMAHHARCPDLLAEQRRFAGGSAPYVSPEQVLGSRSDTRSDLFSFGVVLYEMATKALPFGIPQTLAGLRDRLWLDPQPPRGLNAAVPPWLQEIILRCLEQDVEKRYQSAAHIAFDLRHPGQVPLTGRAVKARRAGLFGHLGRWWKARPMGLQGDATRMGAAQAPVVLVAVDTMHPDDQRHPAIRDTVGKILSLSADFRLICASVVRGEPLAAAEPGAGIHLEHLIRLRHWIAPLGLREERRVSLHVIEALNPAGALLDFARHNNVDLIVIGAPSPEQHALAWWRSVASAVTSNAHCSVHVVRVARAP
jgi:nucleotide-binding universal stress UspA family protein